MISDYLARLICLSLAAFFAFHLLSGLAISAATPWIARIAGRLRPRIAARILLTLRLTPMVLGLFVVLAVCIPSYLRLEPGDADEEISALCVAAAGLAVPVFGLAAFRGWRAVLRSRRCLRHWREASRAGTQPAPMI